MWGFQWWEPHAWQLFLMTELLGVRWGLPSLCASWAVWEVRRSVLAVSCKGELPGKKQRVTVIPAPATIFFCSASGGQWEDACALGNHLDRLYGCDGYVHCIISPPLLLLHTALLICLFSFLHPPALPCLALVCIFLPIKGTTVSGCCMKNGFSTKELQLLNNVLFIFNYNIIFVFLWISLCLKYSVTNSVFLCSICCLHSQYNVGIFQGCFRFLFVWRYQFVYTVKTVLSFVYCIFTAVVFLQLPLK